MEEGAHILSERKLWRVKDASMAKEFCLIEQGCQRYG